MNMNLQIGRTKLVIGICFLAILFALQTNVVQSQPQYDIQVTVDNVVNNNFLGIPKNADFNLQWRVMENRDGSYEDSPISRLNNYEVLYATDSTFSNASSARLGQVNTHTFAGLDVGQRYYFRVQAIDTNNQLFQSAVVWMQAGRQGGEAGGVSEDETEQSWVSLIPLHGKFPLRMLGNSAVYDKSTFLGRAAFWVIWYFFLLGFFIWVSCIRTSRLANIFPFEKYSFKLRSPFQYESVFASRISKDFVGESGIINRWKKTIDSTAELLNDPPKLEGDKNLDYDKFQTHHATWWRDNGRVQIRELLNDINPFCEKYSTARILRAGLANHEINGYKLMEASQEVDRAIENRAVMEIERLKGKAKLEWLWNLGATAPLIGLFGTVTGISVSFKNLAAQTQKGIADSSAKITELAGGINEALWTTIFGLSAGIFLIILYYVFKHKMDWIFGKWEEIYVDVSEKL